MAPRSSVAARSRDASRRSAIPDALGLDPPQQLAEVSEATILECGPEELAHDPAPAERSSVVVLPVLQQVYVRLEAPIGPVV